MNRGSASVAALPVPEPGDEQWESPIAAPALGYSILANLGDEKQITVQCFADSEEEMASIHAKIDRAMAVIDRQKAKYRLKDLRKERDEMEATLARHEDDLARLEETFAANQDAIDARITECVRVKQSLYDAAQARGRGKPVGAEGGQVTALGKEIESLKQDKAKATAERGAARDNLAVNVGRFRDAIAKKNEEIAECEALISDGG